MKQKKAKTGKPRSKPRLFKPCPQGVKEGYVTITDTKGKVLELRIVRIEITPKCF